MGRGGERSYPPSSLASFPRPLSQTQTHWRHPPDPMDVDAVNSLSSGKGKGSSSPRDGFFLSAVEHMQCTQEHCQAIVWQRQTEQVMSKTEGKGKSEVTKGKSKGKIQRKVQRNQRCRRVTQGYEVLRTRNQREARKLKNLHRRIALTLLTRTISLEYVCATFNLWLLPNFELWSIVRTTLNSVHVFWYSHDHVWSVKCNVSPFFLVGLGTCP